MTDSGDQCWCGHPSAAHRATLPDFFPSRTGVIRTARHECRAEWTERGGKDRVHCNCEQYGPADLCECGHMRWQHPSGRGCLVASEPEGAWDDDCQTFRSVSSGDDA